MIARKTAIIIGEVYAEQFSNSGSRSHPPSVYTDSLYDFLFENDHQPWLCNAAKQLHSPRGLKEWIMKFHTGETQYSITQNWSWEQRQALGQRYLHDLAEDYLQWYSQQTEAWYISHYADSAQELKRALELNGYVFRDGMLLYPESDVLDVAEEVGVLERLHQNLHLENHKLAFECLKLSEEHYRAGRWSDCISNARKFLESVLQEIAMSHSVTAHGQSLPTNMYSRPVAVRDYLEREELIEKREREAIDKIYGLLSHTGSHPYMAESDQARLLRQLSLTISQFAMLRFEGSQTNGSRA